MTNKTATFSKLGSDVAIASLIAATDMNNFIQARIAEGCINFCIMQHAVSTEYTIYIAPTIPPILLPTPSGNYWCTIEVKYYDPAVA